ncbi:MAG TPA: arginine deiminase-related protein [Tepidiformaceae bacterium]|nr:arginine deiminase-related protein [Tepidiformaceae bacterium]
MCEPTRYGIEYEINPWMHRANPVDPVRAHEQWDRLVDTLQGLGTKVEFIPQPRGLPDMTFTANAGVVSGNTFFPSNFRFPERRGERSHFIQWFEDHGYDVKAVDALYFWEGEGDVLPSESGSIAGFRFRTELAALDQLDLMLDGPMVRVELADPRFYHLDTSFCPLAGGLALYYPPAFTQEGARLLQRYFPKIVPIGIEDALRFACNALVVSDTVILNAGCRETVAALNSAGYQCIEVPMDEFIKAGGSVKCLVLTLDRFTETSQGKAAG